MRKRVIGETPQEGPKEGSAWLDLQELAEVEISSEDANHPIEAALLPGEGSGWRAAGPGEQTIRLRFAEPQTLKRIRLHFVETEAERAQEFVLRWSSDNGETYREIVRQGWNFSPNGATSQTEDYRVELSSVTALELVIRPDSSGGPARASLAELRLA